jgi:hypothetical protein
MIPIQTGTGVSSGDLANLAGAVLLLLAVSQYVLYRIADDDEDQKEYQRKAVVLFFVFLSTSYAIWLIEDSPDVWVSDIGLALERYFQNFSQNFVVPNAPSPSGTDPTMMETIISGIRTVGLFAYVIMFSTVSIAVKAPVLVIEKIDDMF